MSQRTVHHQTADWCVKWRKLVLLTDNFFGPDSNIGWQHIAKSRIICSSPCYSFKLLLTLELAIHFCSYLRVSTQLDPGINTNSRDWHNSQWTKRDTGYLPILRESLILQNGKQSIIFLKRPFQEIFTHISYPMPHKFFHGKGKPRAFW